MSIFTGYVKLIRSEETRELMKDKNAYMLLTQIALRAKRSDNFNIHSLEIGEALIGDYKAIGLTQQEYRTAKKKLEKWGLITTRTTNKGTIAKIINTDIFDINAIPVNEPPNMQATIGQQADNTQTTTKKKEKNEKGENEKKETDGFFSFWTVYPVKTHKKKCLAKWAEIAPDKELADRIMKAVEAQKIWRNNAMPSEFRPQWPNPYNWLDQERWNDEVPQYENIQDEISTEAGQFIDADWVQSLSSFDTEYPEAYENLRDNINEHSFQAFIVPLKVEKEENNTITLFAFHDVASWIHEHYKGHLEQALQKQIVLISDKPEYLNKGEKNECQSPRKNQRFR